MEYFDSDGECAAIALVKYPSAFAPGHEKYV